MGVLLGGFVSSLRKLPSGPASKNSLHDNAEPQMPCPSLRLATRTQHLALTSGPRGHTSGDSLFEVCVRGFLTKVLTLGTKIGSEDYIAENIQDFRIALLALNLKRHCPCLWTNVKLMKASVISLFPKER